MEPRETVYPRHDTASIPASTAESSPVRQSDPMASKDLHPNNPSSATLVPSNGNKDVEKQRTMEQQVEEEDIPVKVEKQRDPFEVNWEDEATDPENPLNWKASYRWFLTAVSGLLVLNASFASSAPSGIIPDMEAYFGFSQEVAILTLSLFVAGYCVGPILWGPLSERRGRKFTFAISYIPYTGFQVGCALSRNTASILIFRFLGGVFAAAPLSVAGALMADLHRARQRAIALSVFALSPFAGPSLGPIVSGFIHVTGTDWRWLYWVLTMFAGFCVLVILFILPETYGPLILKRRAEKKRKETGDERYRAPMEKKVTKGPAGLAYDLLASPFIMFFTEPLLCLVTIYMSFVYGCLYLLFEALPLIFVETHGFNLGEEGLAFLPLFIGGVIANLISIFVFNKRYEREMDRLAPLGKRPTAETRLEMALLGGPFLVIGFFIMGWTSFGYLSYWGPLIAVGLVGVSMIFLFLPLINYIVDCYLMNAATALSANTILRSAFGAGFPLFAGQMFNALGVPWACSLLGFVSLILAPIPFLFYRYGAKLRKMSKNAYE